jgi:general secretion pathway protein G
MILPSIKRSDGFTIIEILIVVTLVAIVAVASIDVITDTLNETRFQKTVDKMHQIANAMTGNSTLKENGARTSFGFLGDIGAIPTAAQGIAALITNPGLPSWAVNTTVGFGIGWNGSYLTGGDSGTDYTTDGWGNSLVYEPNASPPELVSYGADGAAGGTGFNQDITVTLPTTTTTATVSGYVTDHYTAYTGSVDVQLNMPNGSGVLSQVLYTVTAPTGYFTFSNVPFGTRSITAYIPSQGSPTTTIGPVLITVDKPGYTTPPGILDIDP